MRGLRSYSKTKNFCLCLYLSFLYVKPDYRNSSLSFVRLSWDGTTDNYAMNLKNFAKLDFN